MSINRARPDLWRADSLASVQQYNDWYLAAAPGAYRATRETVVNDVEALFEATDNMRTITPDVILRNPQIIATLRMATAPPLARDRLIGLAYSTKPLMSSLESGRLPARMKRPELLQHLTRICDVVANLLDRTLFDWLSSETAPTDEQRELAAVVVSDRRCGAVSDPIVRNAQEQRQLTVLSNWLEFRGYQRRAHPPSLPLDRMPSGTFMLRRNVSVRDEAGGSINMPIDAIIQPHGSTAMPMLVEAKSAGDFTNTNKRRKEEATKARQLRATYGADTPLILFLCGYFDAGYLGYEAAEGLDWVWEHRVDDFERAGL